MSCRHYVIALTVMQTSHFLRWSVGYKRWFAVIMTSCFPQCFNIVGWMPFISKCFFSDQIRRKTNRQLMNRGSRGKKTLVSLCLFLDCDHLLLSTVHILNHLFSRLCILHIYKELLVLLFRWSYCCLLFISSMSVIWHDELFQTKLYIIL